MNRYFDEKLGVWITVCPPGSAAGAKMPKYKDVRDIPNIASHQLGPPRINYGGKRPDETLRQPRHGRPRKKKRFW